MDDNEKSGHRQRLRERFFSADEDFKDELLLEVLLSFAIRRKDVKPIAEELVRVFGNLDQVLAASRDDLNKIKGLGQVSITLLKAVDFIKSRKAPPEADSPLTNGRDANQLQLFQDPQVVPTPKLPPQSSLTGKAVQTKTQPEPVDQPIVDRQYSSGYDKVEQNSKGKRMVQTTQKASPGKKLIRRKLQVGNSYLLEFDQLARVLNFLLEQKESKRIKRKVLKENTGLADRQVEGLVSMGTAMGLIKPNVQILTPTAYVAHRYGLSRDDFAYILDTFPVLKKKEKKAFGEFMSKRKCLEEYDRIGKIMNAEG